MTIYRLFAVVNQNYEIDVFKETVIKGNDALLKCQIPSFVSDLVQVQGWVDSNGNNIQRNSQGKQQLGLVFRIVFVKYGALTQVNYVAKHTVCGYVNFNRL